MYDNHFKRVSFGRFSLTKICFACCYSKLNCVTCAPNILINYNLIWRTECALANQILCLCFACSFASLYVFVGKLSAITGKIDQPRFSIYVGTGCPDNNLYFLYRNIVSAQMCNPNKLIIQIKCA